MLSEVTINLFSQLVYLDLPAGAGGGELPTVGAMADYYTYDPVGKAYIKTRFGSIPREYEDWTALLDHDVDPVRGYRIRNILDDNQKNGSGFYGCSYISPSGQLVAAFRGSEMLGNRRYKNDYETDFALAYAVQTPQQKMVDQYLTAFDDFRARPYYVTGHSLGGNLALYAAVHAPIPGKMTGCYAFNAPGFNQEYIAENRDRIDLMKERLYLMQNKHDLISSLLLNLTEPVVLESLYDPGEQEEPGMLDILYPHSNFVYQKEGDRFVRAGEKDDLCQAVNKATVLFLGLPTIVKRSIAKILLEVIYSAQSPEKQTEFLLERITKYMVHNGIEADDASLELGRSLFTAKQLYGKESEGRLYKALCDHPAADSTGTAQAVALLLKLTQASAMLTQKKPMTA